MEPLNEDPAPLCQSKKPSQALYVPKQRIPVSKEKAGTGAEVKPRPRPRYTDKARKNTRNRKDRAGAGQTTAAGSDRAEPQNGETSPNVKDERVQHTELHSDGPSHSANAETDVSSRLEAATCKETDKVEEESWDTLFNDDGDCLCQEALELLAVDSRKKQSIQEARFDYYNMDGDDEDDIDLTEDELSHIIEIYDFPAEFKTEDLVKLFQCYQQRGFDIKWIDDKHALGLFSSAVAAREALRSKHPLLKVRPLSKSTSATKAKARSCSDYLLPAKERPQTSAALARKLVIGALGVKSNLTKEQREAERRKLQEAKEQKRLAAKQREDAWEGK